MGEVLEVAYEHLKDLTFCCPDSACVFSVCLRTGAGTDIWS